MDKEDEDVGRPKSLLRNLDEMSIEALHGYLSELDVEIARVKKAIATKEQAHIGANALFKARREPGQV